MLRDDLKDPGAAGRVVAAMVAANPKSGRAYLIRWNYGRKYGLSPDDKDVARALELAPDDADVLLTAAGLAARRDQRAEARRLVERGLKLHPGNAGFYELSAAIEILDSKPDQAEAVLRRGIEALPGNAELGFMLADLLISRRKLDGPDGAESWITRLRDRNLNPGPLKYLEAALLMARGQWADDRGEAGRG